MSFSDAYGLSLIASDLPGLDRAAIVRDLSPKARRIGNALLGNAAGKNSRQSTKKAAKPIKATATHR